MRGRIIVASVITLCSVVMLADVYGQRVGARRRVAPRPRAPSKTAYPLSKGILGPANPHEAVLRQAFPGDDPTAPWAVVSWALNLDPATQALYQQMATLVSGYAAVPDDRLNYYSAVNNPPDYVINGWSGMVTNVQQAAGGGYLVTVSVDPLLSTTAYGAPTVISSDYAEQFYVDVNNNVSYSAFLDPNGSAGQVPALISGD